MSNTNKQSISSGAIMKQIHDILETQKDIKYIELRVNNDFKIIPNKNSLCVFLPTDSYLKILNDKSIQMIVDAIGSIDNTILLVTINSRERKNQYLIIPNSVKASIELEFAENSLENPSFDINKGYIYYAEYNTDILRKNDSKFLPRKNNWLTPLNQNYLNQDLLYFTDDGMGYINIDTKELYKTIAEYLDKKNALIVNQNILPSPKESADNEAEDINDENKAKKIKNEKGHGTGKS